MKATDLLEPDEIHAMTARSDLDGARAVITSWAMIAGAFALGVLPLGAEFIAKLVAGRAANRPMNAVRTAIARM